MDIFEFTDLRLYVRQRIEQMPRNGHGQFKKMAQHLRVSTVMISQIFKGDRQLPMELAHELTEYFGMTDLERRYFLLLAQLARAGTVKYKDHLKSEIQSLRKQSKNLKVRVPAGKELSDEAKAVFYSDWIYSGARLLTSIDEFKTADQIASRFDIPLARAVSVIEFLLQHGLCLQEDGRLKMGAPRTHLEASSPLIKSRQISWRLKGFEMMSVPADENDLFYTAPMALSQAAREEIRKELVRVIERVNRLVPESEADDLACLNIDWFKF